MTRREIKSQDIEKVVSGLCVKANTILREDVLEKLQECYKNQNQESLAKKMLGVLIENAKIAREKTLPLCQDTGMVAVFVEIGKDVIVTGAGLVKAINNGIEKAYKENYFRKSVVEDPILRNNTGTNTPAIVHTDIVDGGKIAISIMPKGFGSENKSRICMLNPTSPPEKIVDFCVDALRIAGADACPPYILGVGIGGTVELCTYLAKKALLRRITESNPKPHIAELEDKIKEKSNALDIGILGLGGPSTVLGVNIEVAPTHIAGLPVAVNISCHALRSASAII